MTDIAGQRLLSIVERYEALDGEIKTLREDQKDLMAEAKGAGFDVKVIKAVIARRKKDSAEADEFETLLSTYLAAIGEFSSTPLGSASAPKRS